MGESDTEQSISHHIRPSTIVPSNITRPATHTETFQIPPQFINLNLISCQFSGLEDEDPNAHIGIFLQSCDTFKFKDVSPYAIKLHLFPFLLVRKAWKWISAQEGGSITTWDILVDKFLKKHILASKINKLRYKILFIDWMGSRLLKNGTDTTRSYENVLIMD
ncbi:uncharacterized protein LOC110933351 [Helianthus annuus]|uniref:uncharacterized protein LOC110933351 n=1 Tax=Helianthus annuus TaxID=4232 RepID=UPI000B904D7D|nr:uncharacterized protein LOC110933351 [Helianthus annuus]